MMTGETRITTKTRLKTVARLSDIRGKDYSTAHAAKLKADLAWQMNLAQIKLNALKAQDEEARARLISFHDAARKSLWYARRA